MNLSCLRKLRRFQQFAVSIVLLAVLLPTPSAAQKAKAARSVTVADAQKFVADAEKRYNDAIIKAGRAGWVHAAVLEICLADSICLMGLSGHVQLKPQGGEGYSC